MKKINAITITVVILSVLSSFVIDPFYYTLIFAELFIFGGIIWLIVSLNKYKQIQVLEEKYIYPISKLNVITVPVVMIIGGLSLLLKFILDIIKIDVGILIYISCVLIIFLLWLIQELSFNLETKKISKNKKLIEVNALITGVKEKENFFKTMRVTVGIFRYYINDKIYTLDIKYSLNGKEYTKNIDVLTPYSKGDEIKIKVNSELPEKSYLLRKPNIWLVLMLIFAILIIIFIGIGLLRLEFM